MSQWSAGSSQAEDSIHKAYCSLIEKAEHFVYIEVSPLSLEHSDFHNNHITSCFEKHASSHLDAVQSTDF